MKFLLILPARKDALIDHGLDYLSRLKRPYSAETKLLAPPKNIDEDQKEKRKAVEGKELLANSQGYFRIALSERSLTYSSTAFADLLAKLSHQHSKCAFLIGGAFGLSDEVLRTSDMLISLSPMTFPHRMAFLLLCEQLYRAGQISSNTAYHK